jgi:hypothetical protein
LIDKLTEQTGVDVDAMLIADLHIAKCTVLNYARTVRACTQTHTLAASGPCSLGIRPSTCRCTYRYPLFRPSTFLRPLRSITRVVPLRLPATGARRTQLPPGGHLQQHARLTRQPVGRRSDSSSNLLMQTTRSIFRATEPVAVRNSHRVDEKSQRSSGCRPQFDRRDTAAAAAAAAAAATVDDRGHFSHHFHGRCTDA